MHQGTVTEILVVDDIPGGITAIHAAYERVTVSITIGHGHLGGILASGISVFDIVYPRTRIPLVDAFREKVCEIYTRDLQPRFDAV